MAVVSDIVESHRVEVGANGFTATRIFIVSELIGDPYAKLYNALLLPDIPQRGTFHPSIPGIQADTITANAVDSNIVQIVVNYKLITGDNTPPDEVQQPQISVGSTIQSKTTNKTNDGTLMSVFHVFTDVDADGNETERLAAQTGEVEIQVPQTTLRFARRESAPPAEKSKYYVGKVGIENSFGDPARYWLCTRIEGNSTDGGKTFQVEYEFQRNASTWDATVVFIDPDTNAPPPPEDIADEDGFAIRQFQVYDEVDFGPLNLL